MKGTVASINISDKKGESKSPVSGKVEVRPGWGIVGDVHAGTPDREITLLPVEALGGVAVGGYGENIDTEGLDILGLELGSILRIGDRVRMQITQHGKVCLSRCSIYYKLGKCIMQEHGVFAVVLDGGAVAAGDEILVEEVPADEQDIEWILERCKRIAVVGASPKQERPSSWIMEFLLDQGYDAIPVRPGAEEIHGKKAYSSLKAIPDSVDLVLIFRRSEEVPPVVQEALDLGVKAIWMQEGIVNTGAFRQAKEGGLRAIMDRCIFKELRNR